MLVACLLLFVDLVLVDCWFLFVVICGCLLLLVVGCVFKVVRC